MPTYTILIEAGNLAGRRWRPVVPPFTAIDSSSAVSLAESYGRKRCDAPRRRVRVWAGAGADVSTPPLAEYGSLQWRSTE